MTLKNAKAKGRKAEWEMCAILDSVYGNPDSDVSAFRPYAKEGETEDPGDIENSLGLPLVVQVKNYANQVTGLNEAYASLKRQCAAEAKWKQREVFGMGMARGRGGFFLACWQPDPGMPSIKLNALSPDVVKLILAHNLQVEYRGYVVGSPLRAFEAFDSFMLAQS